MTFNLSLLGTINQLIYPKSLLLEFDLERIHRSNEKEIINKGLIYHEMSIIIFYSNYSLTHSSLTHSFDIYRYIRVNEFNLLKKTLRDRFHKHSIVVHTQDYYKGHIYLYQYISLSIL